VIPITRPKSALAAILFVACSTPSTTSDPPCVAGLSTDCAATYDPPIYQTIFDKILNPTCATGTGTCHTSDGAKAGLVFENADDAYGLLLGTTAGSHARVNPGDPGCSLIMKRLSSTDPNYRMPPGPMALPAGETCTIVKWIAAGAKR
jgi:hypothetical protein